MEDKAREEEEREYLNEAIRDLVGRMFEKLHGAYGCGDEGYQGEFEEEISRLVNGILIPMIRREPITKPKWLSVKIEHRKKYAHLVIKGKEGP